ncbi:hypothetical protein [Janthinobacterium sp. RB2R34]|uniref:hypothetical protein n=1 Tax=Janthinobacterium sp. RB2R34 TaxID=3424193 RepID=UPI003F246166
MNTYQLLLILHLVAAIAFVGPLLLAPRLLHLLRNHAGRATLHLLHQQIGIAGWILLLAGMILLYQQQWAWLQTGWMRLSLALFIGAQAIDHLWADREESKLENDMGLPEARLKTWLLIKVMVFLVICALMVSKPALSG